MMKCFGFHKKRSLPWMNTRDRSPAPEYACSRCGKLWFRYVAYIPSAERSLFDRVGPQYQGQTPPKSFESWDDYFIEMNKQLDKIIEDTRKMRNKLNEIDKKSDRKNGRTI